MEYGGLQSGAGVAVAAERGAFGVRRCAVVVGSTDGGGSGSASLEGGGGGGGGGGRDKCESELDGVFAVATALDL